MFCPLTFWYGCTCWSSVEKVFRIGYRTLCTDSARCEMPQGVWKLIPTTDLYYIDIPFPSSNCTGAYNGNPATAQCISKIKSGTTLLRPKFNETSSQYNNNGMRAERLTRNYWLWWRYWVTSCKQEETEDLGGNLRCRRESPSPLHDGTRNRTRDLRGGRRACFHCATPTTVFSPSSAPANEVSPLTKKISREITFERTSKASLL